MCEERPLPSVYALIRASISSDAALRIARGWVTGSPLQPPLDELEGFKLVGSSPRLMMQAVHSVVESGLSHALSQVAPRGGGGGGGRQASMQTTVHQNQEQHAACYVSSVSSATHLAPSSVPGARTPQSPHGSSPLASVTPPNPASRRNNVSDTQNCSAEGLLCSAGGSGGGGGGGGGSGSGSGSAGGGAWAGPRQVSGVTAGLQTAT
jgi:hypothetical protein